MLAFCTSSSEISLVLGPSDARWLSEEMSFVAELYRSKAGSSERQFGGDDNDNVALASFWETALKCQRLSVALQQAVSRAPRQADAGRDQHIDVLPATDPPHPALAPPNPVADSGSAERETRPKRARRTTKGRAAKKKKVARPQ
jgi:hypothetical protein